LDLPLVEGIRPSDGGHLWRAFAMNYFIVYPSLVFMPGRQRALRWTNRLTGLLSISGPALNLTVRM